MSQKNKTHFFFLTFAFDIGINLKITKQARNIGNQKKKVPLKFLDKTLKVEEQKRKQIIAKEAFEYF